MFGLGTQELVIVFLIIFVLFGATKLPQIGKGMGEAIRNFKKGMSGINDELDAITKSGDEKIINESTK